MRILTADELHNAACPGAEFHEVDGEAVCDEQYDMDKALQAQKELTLKEVKEKLYAELEKLYQQFDLNSRRTDYDDKVVEKLYIISRTRLETFWLSLLADKETK